MNIRTYPVSTIDDHISHDLFSQIQGWLSSSKKVLLFLSGGSAISCYPRLFDHIKRDLSRSDAARLVVGQVDERFVSREKRKMQNQKRIESSTTDINAVRIGDSGVWEVCEMMGITYHLISQECTMEESVSEYNQTISNIWVPGTKAIAILGIGEDGHTAGLLPGYQSAWDVNALYVGYKNAGEFPQRISLTPVGLRKLNVGYVYAVGEKKKKALDELENQRLLPYNKFPLVIFREMKGVEIYTDQSSDAS